MLQYWLFFQRTLASDHDIENDERDDEILCVHSDGQMELLPSSRMSNKSNARELSTPQPPSSLEHILHPTSRIDNPFEGDLYDNQIKVCNPIFLSLFESRL